MKNENLKELLKELEEQANELIEFGDSKEKSNGLGMKEVIDRIKELLQ